MAFLDCILVKLKTQKQAVPLIWSKQNQHIELGSEIEQAGRAGTGAEIQQNQTTKLQ